MYVICIVSPRAFAFRAGDAAAQMYWASRTRDALDCKRNIRETESIRKGVSGIVTMSSAFLAGVEDMAAPLQELGMPMVHGSRNPF